MDCTAAAHRLCHAHLEAGGGGGVRDGAGVPGRPGARVHAPAGGRVQRGLGAGGGVEAARLRVGGHRHQGHRQRGRRGEGRRQQVVLGSLHCGDRQAHVKQLSADHLLGR